MSEIKVNKISPATSTDITLGDSGDTFTVPSGATIVNSGTATGFGGGKIGQVLSTMIAGGVSTTSNGTYVDVTGLSVAITPTATSSKVLIMVALTNGHTNTANKSHFRIHGGNTDTYLGTDLGSGEQSAVTNECRRSLYDQKSIAMTYLDSPATTSATTYQVQWQTDGGTAWVGRSSTDNTETGYAASTITVMEVLA